VGSKPQSPACPAKLSNGKNGGLPKDIGSVVVRQKRGTQGKVNGKDIPILLNLGAMITWCMSLW